MPDTRGHRGPHPEDATLFSAEALPALCAATSDLTWLLSRGYPGVGAGKLVGDRYQLAARQRVAVARCACSLAVAASRKARERSGESLAGRPLLLDGYNILITIEAALAGGVILAARDGTYRDMASMHGSYRRVSETVPALELVGRRLAAIGISSVVWYLDRPVSNSGRLKAAMEGIACSQGWPWTVELVGNPDAILMQANEVIASADSAVLDAAQAWYNLARAIVDDGVPHARLVVL